jgi:hypothetical protein
MNTILIYMMAASGGVCKDLNSWLYFNGDPKQNVLDLTYSHVFCHGAHYNPAAWLPAGALRPIPEFSTYCGGGAWLWLFDHAPARYAALAWVLFRIGVWTAVAGYLHRARWYWAL